MKTKRDFANIHFTVECEQEFTALSLALRAALDVHGLRLDYGKYLEEMIYQIDSMMDGVK